MEDAGQGAFADQLPFELGQRRENAEHEAAFRGGGVDLRALTGRYPQTHAAGREILHGVDQMGEVAAETVEFPIHEHVALPQGAQAAVESRPVVAYAGSEVVVEVGRWTCSSPEPELRESSLPRAGQGAAKKYRWNLECNSGSEDSAFRAHWQVACSEWFVPPQPA